LHYQPQVEVDTGAITGVETLLRWYHPRFGIIPPAEFIPLAEETGLIIPMGEWVLRQACAQGRLWEAAGLPPFTIAVNLSARQFRHQGLAETVAEVLRQTGLPAARLELEVTESSLVEDLPHATRLLNQLRAMGVSIALDDFGSGYSSLGYLRSFPITTLKIDRLFIQDVPVNPECSAMLRGLKALASSLGLQLLVEGVETAAQLECLQAFDCERAQGFLLSRALPAEVLTSRLTKGRFGTLFGGLGAVVPVAAG
jgi:EAL domain-containing protein (putative c-di-GMP-specific phosphodiesterase class I)